MTDVAPPSEAPSRLDVARAPGRRGRIRSAAVSRAWKGLRRLAYVVVTLVVIAYAVIPNLEPDAPTHFPQRIWCGRARADPSRFDIARTLDWEPLAAEFQGDTSCVWTFVPPGDPLHPARVTLDLYPEGSSSLRARVLRELGFWRRAPRHAGRPYLGTGETLVRDGQTWDSFERVEPDDVQSLGTPK